jgi:hypothetical protein
MKNYTIYDLHTGAVVSIGCTPDALSQQGLGDNRGIIEGHADVHLDYVDPETAVITPRPFITTEPNQTTILADGNDMFLLAGLPVPCVVTVDADAYEITDGEFGFTTVLPGEYTVTVESFPYITRTWEVTAV